MILFTEVTGLLSVALAVVAAGLFAGTVSAWKRPYRVAALCILVVAPLLPIDGLSLAGYVRGVVGDLSITTVVVTMLAIASRVFHRQVVPEKEIIALCGLVVLCGTIFYPMALGATPYDPYRMGYDSYCLPTTLLLLGLAAWLKRLLLIVSCITLAMLAYSVGWYASTNLWDYLIDPVLVVGSLFYLLRRATQAVMEKRRH
jgi:hypothetical protein